MPFAFLLGWFLLIPCESTAQANSVAVVHGDGASGYGVAYGGTDKIVTCLHIVAGKSKIMVRWQNKEAEAIIEKIYKPSDLALLKLKTPLGIQAVAKYPGGTPFDTDVQYYEIPKGVARVDQKSAELEERTSLDKISTRVTGNASGLAKLLCSDGSQYYPSMATSVINFEEPNIIKSHSGSPLAYQAKLLGLVDGGTIVDGKPCVWAIQVADFDKLISQGTAPPSTLKSCEAPGVKNKYMYSGTRSDNPMLTPEEAEAARAFESLIEAPTSFIDPCENLLTVQAAQRVSFTQVFESLFDESAQNVIDLFSEEMEFDKGQRLSLEDLAYQTIDFYQEHITGASLVIPSESTLTTASNSFGNYVTLSSPLGTTTLSVFIAHLDTPEDAEKEMVRFKTMCAGMGQSMNPAANEIKDFRCDLANPYYKEAVENSTLDQNGKLKSEFQATMVVHKNNFVGTIVNVTDWDAMWEKPEERLFFYLLEISGLLTDFILY